MIAVYIDKDIGRFENGIKYTFDFIFKTLGYEFKYIKTTREILSNDILIYYGVVHPSVYEAYEIIFRKMMFFIPFESELYDFKTLAATKLRNNVVEVESEIPIFSTRIIENELKAEEYRGLHYYSFGYDLIGNIFFHLNNGAEEILHDEGNNPFEPYFEKPFVNYLLKNLEKAITQAYGGQQRYFLIKKEMWPAGEKLAVAVSHTIDSLKKWDMKSILKSTLFNFLHFYKVNYIFQQSISIAKYLLTNFEEYWTFDTISEIENEKQIKSTFFLGVEDDFFDYDIEDEDLSGEIDKILNRDCEIALLAPEHSLREDVHGSHKKIISSISNDTKIGVRQQNHSYNQVITSEFHEKNHFHYDSSQYHSQVFGFKNGISTPYRIYRIMASDLQDEVSINAISNHLEIPLAFSSELLKLSQFKKLPYDKAKRIVDDLIENTKKVNGLFAFDITTSSFADINYCEDLFSYIWEKISQEKSFKGTIGEIATWCKKREAVYIREKNRRLNIYFPYSFERFTISIIGDFQIAVIDYNDAEVFGDRIIFRNVQPDTNVTVILEAVDNDKERTIE